MIYTVKAFGIVNKVEVYIFLELSCFFHDPANVGNLISGSSGGSDSKASVYNVRDLGSIPGLGRFPGGGNGNPPQYSWASLVAQMVKNLPAM